MYRSGDYIRAEFRDDESNQSEWMWVRVERDDPGRRLVFGILDNEPVVTDLRLGARLAVSYENIREHRTTTSFDAV